MTAITDANTFIDQNLINVPYQGVPATTLNACLKTITNVFNSYATIASVNSLFGYALDGNFPAALMNAPNQAFTLNGGYVSISALLLFSSGQKYTVGPDGNYILNAANGPAWDWSTGRRRLLIEAIGATNYWLNSEDATAWSLFDCSASKLSNGLLGILSLATLTATGTSGAQAYLYQSVTNGSVWTGTVALVAGSSSTSLISLLSDSGYGVNADSSAVVLSGPGVVTRASGASWEASGLTSTPTIVRVTRTYRATETATLRVYIAASSVTSVGDTLKMGRLQFEPGYGSSYIVAGASPTARAADVVTAASGLLALLTAANAALAIRGTLLSNSSTEIIGSTNRFGGLYLDSTGATALVSDPTGGITITASPPVASKTFGLASSFGGQRKLAFNGGSVVSDTAAEFTSLDTGIAIGSGALASPGNMLIDELIVWPILASDAGLQAQARVYS